MDFVRLLIDDVVPAMNKLRGPITIMPEVKLSSATLGIVGTIDLVVIDGEGRAHIFDYKTKEIGECFGLERRYQHERSYEPLQRECYDEG
jgi:ATP-dependent exoDNAse (exonuclease V) beta subunit